MGNFIFNMLELIFICLYQLIYSENLIMNIKRTNSDQFVKKDSQNIESLKAASSGARRNSNFVNGNSIRISSSFHKQLQVKCKKMKQEENIELRDLVRSSFRFFVCRLCYNNYQMKDTDCMGQCGHTFCLDCLNQYCIYKIKVKEEIFCPQQGCSQKLNPQSNLFKKLPDQIKQKYSQNQLWKQTLDNPNVKLCPSQNCVGGLVDLTIQPPECRKCKKKFCKQCMMDHHEGPCDQNFQDYFNQWKRCPKCKTFIQKTQGCNHMTCRCTHQFCFICLSNWDQSHYECLPEVNNRMFFSQVEEVPKSKAILYLIGLLLLFPFLIVLEICLFAIGIAGSMGAGVFVGPFAMTEHLCKKCDCCCCPIMLVIWAICLPFAIIVGAIAAPVFFTVSAFKPFVQRHYRRYCLSVSFLMEQTRQGQPNRRRQRIQA